MICITVALILKFSFTDFFVFSLIIGTAIYVFFVLFNNNGNGADTLTEANFTVDGNSPVLFQHVPNMAITDVLFNQMVFHQQGLENTQHTLVISTAGVNYDVYVNFDYAIYT